MRRVRDARFFAIIIQLFGRVGRCGLDRKFLLGLRGRRIGWLRRLRRRQRQLQIGDNAGDKQPEQHRYPAQALRVGKRIAIACGRSLGFGLARAFYFDHAVTSLDGRSGIDVTR